MIKRNITLLVMFIILILIGGCTAIHSDNNTNSDNNKNINIENELFEQVEDNLDVKIEYPQIKEDENDITEKINEIIKEAAINEYYDKWNLEGLTIDQSYEIKNQENRLLSIVFNGYVNVEGTAHPTDTYHAVTINLDTGEKLALSDFIESYKDLENSITDNEYEVIYGGLKVYSSDEILSIIRNNFENISIDDNNQAFYVSEGNKICIIVEMSHAEGDYSIVYIH